MSNKPQTTRNRINGILTLADTQYIFIDTPGLHHSYHQYRSNKQIHHTMNRAAVSSLRDADVIVHLVDVMQWTKADDYVCHLLQQENQYQAPVLLVINKMDKLKQKTDLLPKIDILQQKRQWQEIIPISALKKDNTDIFLKTIRHYLPQQPPLYEDGMVTDKSPRFMVAEMIREQLTQQLNQELPYGVTIMIDRFIEEEENRIQATIFVERRGQKAIVIGERGQSIKRIGTAARHRLEHHFNKKTHLNLWVKVRRHQEIWDLEN